MFLLSLHDFALAASPWHVTATYSETMVFHKKMNVIPVHKYIYIFFTIKTQFPYKALISFISFIALKIL